jgi:hypothetical protein
MKKILLFTLILCIATACQRQDPSSYPRWVGDIAHDPLQDDTGFEACDEDNARQYFNFNMGFQYKGEKPALVRAFERAYEPATAKKESGLIRIRFMVNCRGQAGRFRIIGMDEEYQEKTFDTSITNQLLTITKSLDGWMVMSDQNTPLDYYLYLIFKIKDGAIVEIIP